jgi:hypothetical protein
MTRIIIPELFSSWTQRFVFSLENVIVSKESTLQQGCPVAIPEVCSYNFNSLGKEVTKYGYCFTCIKDPVILSEYTVRSESFSCYTNDL